MRSEDRPSVLKCSTAQDTGLFGIMYTFIVVFREKSIISRLRRLESVSN